MDNNITHDKDEFLTAIKNIRNFINCVDEGYLSLTGLNSLYGKDTLLKTKDNIGDISDFLEEFINNSFHKLDQKDMFLMLTIFINLCNLSVKTKALLDLHLNKSSIVAKQIRSKRKQSINPNEERARDLAKQIWAQHSKLQLLDTAYEIKNKLKIRESVGLIQKWIRDLNPNAKKKKTSK